jgi:hypothetical protein
VTDGSGLAPRESISGEPPGGFAERGAEDEQPKPSADVRVFLNEHAQALSAYWTAYDEGRPALFRKERGAELLAARLFLVAFILLALAIAAVGIMLVATIVTQHLWGRLSL